jgi:hypothetical protein
MFKGFFLSFMALGLKGYNVVTLNHNLMFCLFIDLSKPCPPI